MDASSGRALTTGVVGSSPTGTPGEAGGGGAERGSWSVRIPSLPPRRCAAAATPRFAGSTCEKQPRGSPRANTHGIATGVGEFLTAMGLFKGQSKEFFELLKQLAAEADAARPRGRLSAGRISTHTRR